MALWPGQQRDFLGWSRYGFENYRLYSLYTIGDGSCLIHALAQALYKPYLAGDAATRQRLVDQIRSEIAGSLRQVDPQTGLSNYQTISGGYLVDFAVSNPEFRPERLEALFRSRAFLGEEMLVVVSHLLRKTIYVLDQSTQDLYNVYYYPGATAVVILYGGMHFQTVALWDPTEGRFATHFKPHRSLIQFLERRNSLRKNETG